MPRVPLSESWSIDIDESFAARIVDNDLQFVSPGPPPRSIWLAIWSPPEQMVEHEVVAMIRGDLHPSPEQSFDEVDERGRARLATWYPETVDDRTHWGLYGYTLGDDAFVQSAFLVPDATLLDWALDVWRSLRED
jgi:hypothetical protein